jgi:hypothetical protein
MSVHVVVPVQDEPREEVVPRGIAAALAWMATSHASNFIRIQCAPTTRSSRRVAFDLDPVAGGRVAAASAGRRRSSGGLDDFESRRMAEDFRIARHERHC